MQASFNLCLAVLVIFEASLISASPPLQHSPGALNESQTTATTEVAGSPEVMEPASRAEMASVDSARRAISTRILSATDKKEIRACDREKTEFLKQCRKAEPATAEVDQRLNEAKLNSANPNDPAIQALLQKKFLLEKACDDRFTATSRGKQCLAGEQKRRVELDKAIRADKGYQKLWNRYQASRSKTL
jgi:hypothetical protein